MERGYVSGSCRRLWVEYWSIGVLEYWSIGVVEYCTLGGQGVASGPDRYERTVRPTEHRTANHHIKV